MKTKLLFCLLITAFFAKAQYVTIPDANFRNYLVSKHPSCFNTQQLMDTNCNSLVNDTILNLSYKFISDLKGVQYFDGLKRLDCSLNSLVALPKLPSGLTYLECSSNYQLMDLPVLPSNLKYLDCQYCKISNIPTLPTRLTFLNCSKNLLVVLPVLPNNITNLDCSTNKLTSLPTLPNTINSFDCSTNLLTSLPSLPSNLISFNCSSNELTSLSSLPVKLTDLNCSTNKLTSLPTLPNSLINLQCSSNLLTNLPTLPNGIVNLYCYSNQLTTLPTLPAKLYYLLCNSNQLSSLPSLPDSLNRLECGNNPITSLPALPKKLSELFCLNTPNLKCLPYLPASINSIFMDVNNITCLPNKPLVDTPFGKYISLEINWDSSLTRKFPICTPTNNKNNCEGYPAIFGFVFNDLNKNGIKDNDEFPRKGIKVIVQPLGQYTFTNDMGYYEIAMDSLKTYTVSIDAPNYFTASIQTASPTFMGEQITRDFALQTNKDIKDLSATLTPITSFARPGFSFPLMFEVENRGTTTVYGTGYVDFPTEYILDSTSINSVNGNFNFTNLHPGESIKMMVYGRLATIATLGDTLKIRGIVNIYDSGTDSMYSNNISEVKMLIRGSFDPNDKQGPSFVTPQQVQNGDFIEYTIRFQNTGTDTAFTVVVADTLTSNLLPETLEMMSTSHNCKTTVKSNQIYFEFLNILLPDSNTNEVKSHGYVRFKVKPKNTLKLGQNILNTASIYFDYNKPVVTNTVNTKVDEPLLTGIQTVSISSNGLVYPNPVENERLFVSNARGLKYKLNSAQGQLMMNGSIDETGLDVSQLNPGMYMLEIGAKENRRVEKIMIR